jgi:ArsR family transcriptional regulator
MRMDHSAQQNELLARMSSLADPIRLRALRVLERNELGVAELCDVLQLPQSTVSRHLKVLADQTWVRTRRVGTNNLYRMLLDELEEGSRKLWLSVREQTDQWPAIEQDRLRLARLLRDRSADSQAFFAGAAGEWDKLREEFYGRSFAIEAMLSLLPSNYVVADLGCGTGQFLRQLSPHVMHVFGIDNSSAMLKAAKTRTRDLKNITLLRADVAGAAVEPASCDAAIMLLSLSYVESPERALASMSRLLKPGGKAVIVDLLPHDRDDFRRQMGQTVLGFSPSQLQQMLTSTNFHSIHVRPLDPEPNVKGPALFLATTTKL